MKYFIVWITIARKQIYRFIRGYLSHIVTESADFQVEDEENCPTLEINKQIAEEEKDYLKKHDYNPESI